MVWFCGCMFTVCQFIDGVDGWACLEWSAWLFQWRNGENQDSQRHGWCQSFGNRPLQIQRHLLHPSVGGLLRNICFVSFWSMKGGTSLFCPCPRVCLFCILDMLLTNLHPFTLSSLKTCIYLNTFVSLQTFAIPGSIFLSILSGYLFPFPLALFLVCLVSISAHVLVLTMSKCFYQLL